MYVYGDTHVCKDALYESVFLTRGCVMMIDHMIADQRYRERREEHSGTQ